MPKTEEEESRNNDGEELCAIRGRVTYVRGPVPLAEVRATLQTASEITSPTTPPTASEITPTTASTTAPADTSLTTSTAESVEVPSATTDLAGAYQLLNLQPGSYEVTVTPPKGWNYTTKPQYIELAPGEVKVADFLLEKIPLETIFEGRVLDGNGALAKGARLEGVICGTNLESAATLTDSEGRFIFKDVVPGARFVRVMLPGHLGEVHDFTIEEGQTISLDFNLKKASYRIHGTITNEEGKPCEATVRLFQNNVVVQKWETTKEDGTYEFFVNEGEYSILVQAPFYQLAGWNELVSEDRKMDFQLARIEQPPYQEIDFSPQGR